MPTTQLGASAGGGELQALTVLVDQRQRAGGRREQVTYRLGDRLQQFSMAGRGERRAQVGGQPGQLTQSVLDEVGHRRPGWRVVRVRLCCGHNPVPRPRVVR